MQTQIQWLGHSTFLITSPSGKRILIDPWVQGNPACPENAKRVARRGHYADHTRAL
jgi:L-ascorbate metabolism protein UlaG (beta-lactamase superfamily)